MVVAMNRSESRNSEAQALADWLHAILKREPTSNDVLDMTLPKLQALHAYANCAAAADATIDAAASAAPATTSTAERGACARVNHRLRRSRRGQRIGDADGKRDGRRDGARGTDLRVVRRRGRVRRRLRTRRFVAGAGR